MSITVEKENEWSYHEYWVAGNYSFGVRSCANRKCLFCLTNKQENIATNGSMKLDDFNIAEYLTL